MNDISRAFELGMRSYAQYRDMTMTLRVMRHRRKLRNAAEREAFRIGWTFALAGASSQAGSPAIRAAM